MTVGGLIERLQKYPLDMEVYMNTVDDGCEYVVPEQVRDCWIRNGNLNAPWLEKMTDEPIWKQIVTLEF